MPTSVVVSPESRTTYPNQEEHAHVAVIGGPAVVIQNGKSILVDSDSSKPQKLGEGGFDIFTIESARLTFYTADDKLPSADKPKASTKKSASSTKTAKKSTSRKSSASRTSAKKSSGSKK